MIGQGLGHAVYSVISASTKTQIGMAIQTEETMRELGPMTGLLMSLAGVVTRLSCKYKCSYSRHIYERAGRL